MLILVKIYKYTSKQNKTKNISFILNLFCMKIFVELFV